MLDEALLVNGVSGYYIINPILKKLLIEIIVGAYEHAMTAACDKWYR
jgi:hypothetical protein